MIDIGFVKAIIPQLLSGAWFTLQIAFFGSIVGFVGGTLLGVGLSSNSRLLRIIIGFFVTIIRGTPMLLQIMFFYLMLPNIGIFISPLVTAIIAIGINSSAYISQIVKSGIASVSKGQLEAAATLGLSRYDTTRYIVLPQALQVVIPALANEFITLIKDSSLAYLIGVPELYMRGNIIVSQQFNAIGVYALVGAVYLCLTSFVSVIFMALEHFYRKPHARN